MNGRIWAAEAAWGEAGFNDGRADENGASIRMPLGSFKHVVACVSLQHAVILAGLPVCQL